MKKPRLVATDLDGTFLSPDGTVSEENRRAVAAAAAADLPLVFVTGRPPRWLGVLADLPLAHPTVIASNGAMLWDIGENRALWAETIPGDLALAAVHAIRSELPEASFGFEQGMRFGFDATYHLGLQRDEALARPEFFTGEVEEMAHEPFVKLLVQHDCLSSDDLADQVSHLIGDTLTVTHSTWGRLGLLELSAPGVTKATTLARYAESLGVSADEVAAFGDMPNDMSMLSWAGMPFVMAESHPTLFDLPRARRIGSNADSAVGRMIQEWV